MGADPWARQRALLGEGQERLASSRALVIGCGGLGAGAIPALVASGAGQVRLMDDDVVNVSNLNRQTLFTASDLGARKAVLARDRMAALSPSTSIEAIDRRLVPGDLELVAAADVVLDCTDSNVSRSLISRLCQEAGVPWVWAGVNGWHGIVSTFVPGAVTWEEVVGPQVQPVHPPQVLGATPALLGAWQAAEAIKVLTGLGRPLSGRLLVVDLLAGAVRTIDLA